MSEHNNIAPSLNISLSDFFKKRGQIKFIELATTKTYLQPDNKAALILNGNVRHTNLSIDELTMLHPSGEAVSWPLWYDAVPSANATGNCSIFQKGWHPVILPPKFRLYFEGDQDVFLTLVEIDI